jgi:hypothetical protein
MTSSSDTLKGIFSRGDTVPLILRHVSRSGVQRTIDVLDPHTLRSLASEVSDVLGLRRDLERGGVIVHGAGMDMLFKLVWDLGLSLYGDGLALRYNEL